MRNGRNLLAIMLVLVMLVFLSACGGSGATNETVGTGTNQDSVETTAAADSAGNAAQTEAVTAVASDGLPTADSKATVDSLLGSWVDIDSAEKFANITKTDSGYQYEDNDATYEATFADGVLTVKVSDTDSAQVYLDSKSGNMIATYQDGYQKFKKK
jgi:hypothetical protein